MDSKSTKIYIGAKTAHVGNIVRLTGALYRALEDEGVLLDVLSAYEGKDPDDCQQSILRMIRESTLGDGNIMREGSEFLIPLTLPEHVKIDGPVHRSIEKCALKCEMSALAFAHTLKDEGYAIFAFTSEQSRIIGDCKLTAFGDGFADIAKHMGFHPLAEEVATIEALITQHYEENPTMESDNAPSAP
ncbi:hypothetical protein [Sulfitobacter sp. R18_1]|uniref:hypothetical protein n=1 Tax=Sulfitobacter sp. R18_1 TaxID=2821104 RepID=UPI001ADADF3D|nr:hypothetical protein [Sulfitobacter sp. R18_1]MBO9427910.1 hypothetical protein [Sulfitobacter sp. R18_1]